METITRTCKKCCGVYPLNTTYFYKDKKGRYFGYTCKKCVAKNTHTRYVENAESKKSYNKKRYYDILNDPLKREEFKIKEAKRHTIAWKNITPKRHEELKLYKRQFINILHDDYICNLLTSRSELEYSDIPRELIELKRKQLLLIRSLKIKKLKQ